MSNRDPRFPRAPRSSCASAAAPASSANRESLVVILTAVEDGATLPGAASLDFWRAAAAALKNSQGVVFSLFNEPSTRGIAGDRAAAWRAWNTAMQSLVDAIRAAGAAQVIAAPSFHDALDFHGFGREFYLRDPDVIYEVHPFFDRGVSDDARDRNFGSLVNDVAVYAGDWGAGPAGCDSVSTDAVIGALAYFDRHYMSWTATNGRCDLMAQIVLAAMTGDPNGFGSLDRTQVASATGGFPGPIAPGEVISLYGQLIGPQEALGPHLTGGRVDDSLAGVQVFFDGIAAPVLLAGYFQVNVQVPYELAGRKSTVMQLVYRDVPSNKLEVEISDAAPGIFTKFTGGSEALALNEDGSINGPANPAAPGSIVALYATGCGHTSPPSLTGVPASAPLAGMGRAFSVNIGNASAETLYAGSAPTLVGVTQVNARVPEDTAAGRASVTLQVGSQTSRSGVQLWIQ
jgi:uncharacterized protein (TIGR03437 family)